MEFSALTTIYDGDDSAFLRVADRVDARNLRSAEVARRSTAEMARAYLEAGREAARSAEGARPRAADSHVRAFQQVEREAKKAASEVERINRQTARNAEQNDRLLERSARQLAQVRAREARRQADDFIRELERMRRAEGRAAAERGGDTSGALSAVSGGRLAFAGGGVAAGVGAAALAFGAATKTGVEYRETIDRLSRSFETLLGSQAASIDHLKELERFAARTPFEFQEVAEASQKFLNMGIAARDVIPILTAVGNAVARTGGGSQQVEAVARAIAQVGARGKVSAEEMNQMADALVDGWGPLERELGKTRAEVMEMAKAGEISAETFVRAFRRAHESGSAMSDQMKTLTGSTSTLTDAGKQLLGQAYSPLHGMLKALVVEGAALTTEGWKTERMFKALGEASLGFLDNFAPARLTGIADQLRQIRMLLDGPPTPRANWGYAEGPWGEGVVNIPKEFQYKPRIPDEDLAKTQAEAFRRAKEQGVADILKEQEEAQRKAEEAARKARQEGERQAGAVGNLRERLRDLTIQNELYNASQVEQEIALMRARAGVEDLTGEYRKQAEQVLNLTAFQMRALAVREELKEAREKEKRQAEATEAVNRQARATLQELLGVEETHFSRLQAQTVVWYEQGVVLDRNTEKVLRYVAAGRDLVEVSQKLLESAPGFTVDISVGEGPWVDPSTLAPAPPNVFEDIARRRREMIEVGEDMANIFSNVFQGLEDGWRGMWQEMLNVARQTLQDISRELLRTALTGQKSGAGGIIGMAANWIGGALFGGVSGSVFGGGGNFAGAGAGGGYASGTPSATPGLHWVGEEGPELVNFRGGERVFNNAESQRMAGGEQKIYNISISVPPSRVGGYLQPKDRMALAQDIVRLLG